MSGNLKALEYHHGGLMRCCTQTLQDRHTADTLPKERDSRVRCTYCDNAMKLDDKGVWRWDRHAIHD